MRSARNATRFAGNGIAQKRNSIICVNAADSSNPVYRVYQHLYIQVGVKKIPRVKDLNAEYSELFSSKKESYAECRKVKNDAQELMIAKQNIESLYEAEKK